MIGRLAGLARSDEKDGRDRPGGESGRFRLIRYYLFTSLPVIGIVTVLAGFVMVARAERDFAERSTTRGSLEAAHLAQMFYQSIGQAKYLEDPDPRLEDLVNPEAFGPFARVSALGLNIVRMSFLNLEGRILWSSDDTAIGSSASGLETFETVLSQGIAAADLSKAQTITDMAGGQDTFDVVTAYFPIRNSCLDFPREGLLIGVLQIDQDVTEELAVARNDSLLFAIVGSVPMGLILFVLLLLIIVRADRIIRRTHARLIQDQIELRAAQEQNIRSARLAAVGELVSGVAHELNNPLAGIWGKVQLLVSRSTDQELKRELESINREAERSVQIVANLLTFAR